MIRFRYWSHKSYAVFSSLGKHVTIGFVCKSIVEAALTKNAGRHRIIAFKEGTKDLNLLSEGCLVDKKLKLWSDILKNICNFKTVYTEIEFSNSICFSSVDIDINININVRSSIKSKDSLDAAPFLCIYYD